MAKKIKRKPGPSGSTTDVAATYRDAVQHRFGPAPAGKALIRSSDGKVIDVDEVVDMTDPRNHSFRTVPEVQHETTFKSAASDIASGDVDVPADLVDEVDSTVRADAAAQGVSLSGVPGEGSELRRSFEVPVPDAWKDDPSPAFRMAQSLGMLPGAPAPETDPVEASVAWFSWLVPTIQKIARGKSRPLLEQDRGSERLRTVEEDARRVWPHLNNARVFAIPQPTYAAVLRWADVITTTEIVGQKWTNEERVFDEEEAKSIMDAGEQRPFPERLPFDDALLVYGEGIALTDHQAAIHTNLPAAEVDVEAALMCHLLTAQGEVWEFIMAARDDGQSALFLHCIRDGAKWTRSLSLMPWVVPSVIDLVNSFKALVHEQPRGLAMRTKWEKDRRAAEQAFKVPGKKVPPPFYRVELRHELIEERLKEHSKQHRTWRLEHRCDVRGHERARIARGPLPLDPKLEERFLQRGYRVYTSNAPSSEDPAWRVMAERHERPKTPGEWVAIKVSWVKPHIRGPEGAPYVPAIRTLPASMEEP